MSQYCEAPVNDLDFDPARDTECGEPATDCGMRGSHSKPPPSSGYRRISGRIGALGIK